MTELLPTFKPSKSTVVVIGLGHVGLPVALGFAGAGFTVLGVDRDDHIVGTLCSGRLPHSQNEPGLQTLLARARKAAAGEDGPTGPFNIIYPRDVEKVYFWREQLQSTAFIIAVDVPWRREESRVDYHSLREAATMVRTVLEKRAATLSAPLVAIASTVPPGTTMEYVLPILRGDTLPPVDEQRPFLLATCPERVTEGQMLWNLAMLPRVIGGASPDSTTAARRLYEALGVSPNNICWTDATTAEFVKCAENAYRDVQLAFANEMALLARSMGVNVWEARDLINTCPGRDMLRPGPGVGGHCIPKDTYLLLHPPDRMVSHRASLLHEARIRNNDMLSYTALLIERLVGLTRADKPTVTLLGITSRADASDTRNSPGLAIAAELRTRGFQVHLHDPHALPYAADAYRSEEGLYMAAAGSDALVLVVDHTKYWFDLAMFFRCGSRMRTKRFIDLRGCFNYPEARQRFKSMGWQYHALGDGKERCDESVR